MAEAKPLKKGDRCPNCGGALEPAPTMTAEQHDKAYDRENPTSMPSHVDTAHPDVRAELGDLYRCVRCSYATRFKGEPAKRQTRDEQQREQIDRENRSGEPGDEARDEPAADPDDRGTRPASRAPTRRA